MKGNQQLSPNDLKYLITNWNPLPSPSSSKKNIQLAGRDSLSPAFNETLGNVNTTTIYGLDDRYRGVKGGRRVVFVNPADIAALGLTEGDMVDLVSEFEGQERRAEAFRVVGYATPVGNAAAYYPETNPLVPLDHVAARSNTPVSKAIVVRLEKSTVESTGGSHG